MHSDLATRRRVLFLIYQRYIAAERAWTDAQREIKAWYPTNTETRVAIIGNPGSAIRRLYEQRERAILQLEVARGKLEVARQRLETRRQEPQTLYIAFVTHAGPEFSGTRTPSRPCDTLPAGGQVEHDDCRPKNLPL